MPHGSLDLFEKKLAFYSSRWYTLCKLLPEANAMDTKHIAAQYFYCYYYFFDCKK